MKFLVFLVAFYLLMMNSCCDGTARSLVKKRKTDEKYTYRACPLNKDKPNCVKASLVIPDYCKDEFYKVSKNDTIGKSRMSCIGMKTNGFLQYNIGTLAGIVVAEDEHCSGLCDYRCLQMDVELLNGDFVAKIPLCENQLMYGYIVEWDI